jgi:hypothetical protein
MDGILRTTTVEFQGRLEGDAFLGGGRLGVRQLGSVEGVDVSLVVLIVMECHDLLRDVRLEAIVRVRQGREGVVTNRRRRHGSCGGCVCVRGNCCCVWEGGSDVPSKGAFLFYLSRL